MDASEIKNNEKDEKKPWWRIVLEAIAYIIGLLLAGIGTTSAARMAGVF